MYSRFQLTLKFIRYYITASNGHGHGTHSPFVFDFIKNILNNGESFPDYGKIENLRSALKKNNTILEIEDFGAGSTASKSKSRSVSLLAKQVAKPSRFGRLFYRIARYYNAETMLELGTSLGLSTAYLASANPKAKVYTLEGSHAIAVVAANNFKVLDLQNIQLVIGNFDQTLDYALKQSGKTDLVFVDGNHRKDPTLRYFRQLLDNTNSSSVLIFDDIHWSAEMEIAWEEIKQHPRVLLTIDLFFVGLVFFRPEFKVKQHFIIRF